MLKQNIFLKQSLIYLVLSILVVFFARYAHLLIVYIELFFTYINIQLTPIFSPTGWGLLVRKTLVLLILPIILVGIPALIYRLIKGKDLPHFLVIVWVVWTIIVLSDVLIR